MPAKFSNNASATLSTSITSAATTIVLSTGQGAQFPALTGSDYFMGTLVNSSNQLEIVKVTARSGDSLTVLRAQESTTARAYAAGDKLELRPTALALNNMAQLDAANTMTGNNTFSGTNTFSGATAFSTAPTVPTATAGTSNTQPATTAFVGTAITNYNTNLSVTTSQITNGAVTLPKLAATGTPSVATFLRGDNTWAIIGGSADLTYTSTTTSFTLTNASAQQQRLLQGATAPFFPSLTMPNMTTMQAGSRKFTIANTLATDLGLADAGGVVREYVYPGTADVAVYDTSTASGVWSTGVPPNVSAGPAVYDQAISGFSMGGATVHVGRIIRISTTQVVYCWDERTGQTVTIYAKLYTLNTTTHQLTAGNTLTITSHGSTGLGDASAEFFYDCDNAGHALLGWQVAASSPTSAYYSYAAFCGLSVSSGTLYASTVTSQSQRGHDGACEPQTYSYPVFLFLGYLGNNAYAVGFGLSDGYYSAGAAAYYMRLHYYSVTVTGTTTVTMTSGTGSSTLSFNYTSTNQSRSNWYSARTGINTFSAYISVLSGAAYAFTYTPATNTVSVATRSTYTKLVCEENNSAWRSSIADAAFVYSTASTIFKLGGAWFEASAPGTASVTVTQSLSVKYKNTLSTGYATGYPYTGYYGGASYYQPGTQILLTGGKWQSINNASATLDVQVASAAEYDVLLSSDRAISISVATNGMTFYTYVARIATPYIL